MSAPNLSTLDFPALTVADSQNVPPKYVGDDLHQRGNAYRSSEKDNLLLFKSGSSVPSRGATDFASAVRKLASQDSGMWKYDRNGSGDSTIGSSRSSHGFSGTYNGTHGRSIFGDKSQSRGSARSAPFWLETGDAVGKLSSLMNLVFRCFNYELNLVCIYISFHFSFEQQICILSLGRKLGTMHVYVMHILSRYFVILSYCFKSIIY